MDRGLVVFDDTEMHRELLREAGEYAVGSGAELMVLTLVQPSELDQDIETLGSIGTVEDVSYDSNTILSAARSEVEEAAEDVLSDLDVSFTAAAAVSEEGEWAGDILDIAEDKDCDHVFIVGRTRSPTGKVLFGDVAQQVILNFDGRVTITTE